MSDSGFGEELAEFVSVISLFGASGGGQKMKPGGAQVPLPDHDPVRIDPGGPFRGGRGGGEGLDVPDWPEQPVSFGAGLERMGGAASEAPQWMDSEVSFGDAMDAAEDLAEDVVDFAQDAGAFIGGAVRQLGSGAA